MRRITLNPQDIIDEDDDLLVVCKPAGIAVQSKAAGSMDLEHLLLHYLVQSQQNRTQLPPGKQREAQLGDLFSGRQSQQELPKGGRELPYLGIVHRLDQPVEGLLVFAKTRQAAAALSAQLPSHLMSKEYLAVVEGIPTVTEGCLTDYLLRDGRQNRSAVVDPGTKGAKKAILHYSCLKTDPTRHQSLLKIHLVTGRHHQIRVQLAHAGLPLVGDYKYNPDRGDATRSPENAEDSFACGRAARSSTSASLALCAYHLAFHHPITGKKLEYQVVPKGSAFVYFRIADRV